MMPYCFLVAYCAQPSACPATQRRSQPAIPPSQPLPCSASEDAPGAATCVLNDHILAVHVDSNHSPTPESCQCLPGDRTDDSPGAGVSPQRHSQLPARDHQPTATPLCTGWTTAAPGAVYQACTASVPTSYRQPSGTYTVQPPTEAQQSHKDR